MSSESHFAVLLNPNARRVRDAVRDRITELVDPDDVFVSHDEREAEAIAATIRARGYDTVFTGGGDGTVTQFINTLPQGDHTRIGILRLGTGNAMAEIVSSGDPMSDLRTYVDNPSSDSYDLHLCEADGTRFAFAGLGLDAAILNDFEALRSRFGRGPMRKLVQNIGGYLAATFGITVPRMLGRWARRQQTLVRVTNLGADAHAIASDGHSGGQLGRAFAAGEVMYEGPVNGVLFGTCPFYGYRLKALPYAGVDPTRFHLRLSNVPTARLIAGMHSLWKGTLQHPGLLDFHAQRVKVELSEPMPYQLAGEPRGFREELEVGLSGEHVDLVRFI